MSIQSPAFAFDEPVPPFLVTVARAIAARLADGSAVSRGDLSSLLTEYFGGSDTDGRWSVRDAHAALKLAQVLYLQGFKQLDLATPAPEAEKLFAYRSFPILRKSTPKIPPHQIWLHVDDSGRMRTRITRNPLLFHNLWKNADAGGSVRTVPW